MQEGLNGALARPDDRSDLAAALHRAMAVPRTSCRQWVEQHCSQDAFAGRIEAWLQGLAR